MHILWGGGIENNSPAKAICFVLCVRVRVCVNESAQRLISDFYERPPRCFHPHTRASLRFILWEVNSCPEPDSPIPISDTCAQLLEGGKKSPLKESHRRGKKRDTHVNEIIVTTKPAWAAWRWFISLFDPRPPKINKDLKKKRKRVREKEHQTIKNNSKVWEIALQSMEVSVGRHSIIKKLNALSKTGKGWQQVEIDCATSANRTGGRTISFFFFFSKQRWGWANIFIIICTSVFLGKKNKR